MTFRPEGQRAPQDGVPGGARGPRWPWARGELDSKAHPSAGTWPVSLSERCGAGRMRAGRVSSVRLSLEDGCGSRKLVERHRGHVFSDFPARQPLKLLKPTLG